MCGRFTLNSTGAALASDFDLAEVVEFEPRFNIAPTQPIAVVRMNPDRQRECEWLRWGLIPHWSKDPSGGFAPINARSETAAEKPTFRNALARRRCLIPTSGFYEWQAQPGGGPKQPFLFRMGEASLFALAGLHERWRGKGGEIIESATILTTEANATLAPVHARMPVILSKEDHARWLDPEQRDAGQVADLMVPCPDDWLEAIAVGTQVNNPRFDDPACIAPLA